jgi:hypothetical protein
MEILYTFTRLWYLTYAFRILPQDLEAEWLRVVADKDCQAMVFFHGRSPRPETLGEASLFDAVADADSSADYTGGLIRPVAHKRSLQWLIEPFGVDGGARQSEYCEVDLEGTTSLAFTRPAESREEEVREIARIKQDFEVDFEHTGFQEYGRFTVPPGKTLKHEFPAGFQAHWVRLKTDAPCRATAMLRYD